MLIKLDVLEDNLITIKNSWLLNKISKFQTLKPFYDIEEVEMPHPFKKLYVITLLNEKGYGYNRHPIKVACWLNNYMGDI